ncbi:uncharacterized protein [Penaeus vannamei]|uniref:uncharacterized protein n=1 Tax=Penaeus vannamei TaxID=6689 RepID=UPI00387F68BA
MLELARKTLISGKHFPCLKSFKLRVFKAMILPVLLYGSETWTPPNALETRLDVFCNKSLHQIMVCSWQNHVSNRRFHHEPGMEPVSCIVHDRHLRHLARFPVDDPAHQVVSLRDNPARRRPMGKPRKLWLDQTCREEL